ncbi:hypothetical protein COO60DRAFT_79473 [Scenedesmus sp. NREL 46B-D3]|nr:hypothetical protein COO60DRAFT_79473 [Scenedesmus sp. NREL 46B-D3]
MHCSCACLCGAVLMQCVPQKRLCCQATNLAACLAPFTTTGSASRAPQTFSCVACSFSGLQAVLLVHSSGVASKVAAEGCAWLPTHGVMSGFSSQFVHVLKPPCTASAAPCVDCCSRCSCEPTACHQQHWCRWCVLGNLNVILTTARQQHHMLMFQTTHLWC